ncbi:TPA: hypothetical protein ACKJ4J_001878, partial [Neisseria gonorrhoeae]
NFVNHINDSISMMMKEREFEIENHLYKGRSIDGKTHYGENVLLIILLEQALLRQADYIVN